MKSIRKFVPLAVAGAVFSVLAACGSSSNGTSDGTEPPTSEAPSSEAPMEDVTLRLGIGTDSPIMMLRAITGAFDDAPYTIEWVEFDGTAAILEGLAAGAIDIAPLVQSPTALIAQGNAETAWTSSTAPFTAIAAWGNPSYGFSLVVRDSAVTDAAGLEGGKVAFSRGSLGHYFWSAKVDAGEVSNVEEVIVPPAEGRAALQSGAVDGLLTQNRNALILQRNGAGTIIESTTESGNYSLVTLATPAILGDAAAAPAIEDFLQRMADASAWVVANGEEVAAYYIETLEMHPDDAATTAESEHFTRTVMDDAFIATLKKIVAVFVGNGVLPAEIDPTVIVDTRFD